MAFYGMSAAAVISEISVLGRLLGTLKEVTFMKVNVTNSQP